jgi:hypothetical protein
VKFTLPAVAGAVPATTVAVSAEPTPKAALAGTTVSAVVVLTAEDTVNEVAVDTELLKPASPG